jgi:hypothetical protein
MTRVMAAIDRRKHDIDVIERVLGGARDRADDDGPQTEVVESDVRPWLAGTTSTSVQVTVGAHRKDQAPPQEPADPRPADRTDEYDSDRRGEHSYPEDDRAEPSSHRERDALKSRLERRG